MSIYFHRPTTPRRGFTLMEIMVSVVIFAIMITALFASFQTGMKAYTMGTETMDRQQLGRYAVNQFSKDLRNIYYKPESQYNVARRQQEALQMEAEENLMGGRSENRNSARSNQDLIEDESLPDLGPPIDLSFSGEDGGEVDQISFVRRLDFSLSENSKLWGLGRVTYYVVDETLYRAVDDVTKPETDEDGYIIPKLNPPDVSKVADNCVAFDVQYGYYYDEEWLLADSWDSSAAQYRNPPSEDEEDAEFIGVDGRPSSTGGISTENLSGALKSAVEQQMQQNRADELPGWVEVTFKFANDPDHPERTETYRQTITLSNKYAVETYVSDEEYDTLNSRRGSNRDRGEGNENRGNSVGGPGQAGGGRNN